MRIVWGVSVTPGVLLKVTKGLRKRLGVLLRPNEALCLHRRQLASQHAPQAALDIQLQLEGLAGEGWSGGVQSCAATVVRWSMAASANEVLQGFERR